MDQRLEKVLIYLIEDYIRTAEPVSSQALVRERQLDVSSATVRNWFALLEAEGFLLQPHTSAGRIPSDRAYMWYVEKLGTPSASTSEKKAIEDAKADAGETERIKRIAKACVGLTGVASLAGTDVSDTYYTGLTELFSHPEFQDWSRVISMSSVLDQLDRQLNQLRKKLFETPTVLLGESCPFGNACGSVLLTVNPNALLVLLGPVRMDYKRARNVLGYVAESLRVERDSN